MAWILRHGLSGVAQSSQTHNRLLLTWPSSSSSLHLGAVLKALPRGSCHLLPGSATSEVCHVYTKGSQPFSRCQSCLPEPLLPLFLPGNNSHSPYWTSCPLSPILLLATNSSFFRKRIKMDTGCLHTCAWSTDLPRCLPHCAYFLCMS